MKLALHIFRKDSRRLWWEVAVTWGLMAWLSHMDSLRSDFTPGPTEGLMHLIVAAAWCYLAALLVQQEPLTGDHAFWLTRPYSRRGLAAAKALFAVVYLHLPSVILAGAVIAARGFQPLDYTSNLLWREAALIALLTLPAAALAAVTRNLAQFGMSVLSIVAGIALFGGGLTAAQRSWRLWSPPRAAVLIAFVAMAALAVLAIQYRKRRALLARSSGAFVAAAAAGVLSSFPSEPIPMLECASLRTVELSFAPNKQTPARLQAAPPFTSVLPVEARGLAAGETAGGTTRDFTLITSSGQRWKSPPFWNPTGPPQLRGEFDGRDAIRVTVDPRIVEPVTSGPVTIRGSQKGFVHAASPASAIPVPSARRSVHTAGLCASELTHEFTGRQLLKVTCESPARIPLVPVVLRAKDGREWRQGLGDSGTVLSYPHQTWLSPIHRRQTFFQIVEQDSARPGDRWMVPRSALSGADIIFTPQPIVGCASFDYELRAVDLKAYRTPTLAY